MARTAVSGRLTGRLVWRVARLIAIRDETPTARTLIFDQPGWPGHLPGQHVDVRLTAEDGYSTQRSYSLAAPVDGDHIELTVQRVPDGEVSPYLTEVFSPGDPVEIRGPVGGWFVRRPDDPAPALLVAGGSGIVPVMAMIRAHHAVASTARLQLIYSTRTPSDQFYSAELRELQIGIEGIGVSYVHTRAAPVGSGRATGRIGRDDLALSGWLPDSDPAIFVCGPTGFVETVATMLIDLGHAPQRIKTERFGPTGG